MQNIKDKFGKDNYNKYAKEALLLLLYKQVLYEKKNS